jgi:hypothetical protein
MLLGKSAKNAPAVRKDIEPFFNARPDYSISKSLLSLLRRLAVLQQCLRLRA